MPDANPTQPVQPSPAEQPAPRPDPRAAARPANELWMDTAAADRELESMHYGTPIQCEFCVGRKFRRSRLRAADIRQLLLMRYPVRCTRCSQRQNVSFTIAGISMPVLYPPAQPQHPLLRWLLRPRPARRSDYGPLRHPPLRHSRRLPPHVPDPRAYTSASSGPHPTPAPALKPRP